MKHRNHFDQNGDLRDIFAALAMQSLMNQGTPVPKWVAAQAYRYADAMLDVREEVSDTNTKEKLINE
ncbi:MAG: hypothetical protein EBU08_09730 [Micrococcales bacterium]|jgi:hypothetical protein|nr:hypothetical protein [Micrococcales bacterium]